MSEPQDDLSELVRTLADVAPSDIFEFQKVQPDGTKKPYRVRVQMMRIDEEHQVLQSAQAYAKARGEVPREYGDLYKEGQAVALLTKALRRVDKRDRPDGTFYYPQIFTTEEQLRMSLTQPEMAQCLNMYEIVRAKYGATLHFSDDDLSQWVDRLGDPLRGPFFLSLLDSSHWPNLLLRLAQVVREASAEHQASMNSPDSSESDPSSSAPGTGSFSSLPSARSIASDEPLPEGSLLTREQAAELAKRIYKRDE